MTVVNLGITEERARQICDEKIKTAARNFSKEANVIANQRSWEFSRQLIQMMADNGVLASFIDPSFQFLLGDAQMAAASTDKKSDYDTLCDLMLRRAKNKSNDVSGNTIIRKAIEVVTQITDDALLGLTLFCAVARFRPTLGPREFGLHQLENMFNKLIDGSLPKGEEWLDYLDMLGVIGLSPGIGGTKKLEDAWYDTLDGYVSKGIKDGTQQRQEAADLIAQLAPVAPMTEHEDGYFKLAISNRQNLDSIPILFESSPGKQSTREPNKHELVLLNKIYDLYSTEKITKEEFIQEIEKMEHLKILRQWWNDTFPSRNIHITPVGKMLAHVNIQRLDRALPSII